MNIPTANFRKNTLGVVLALAGISAGVALARDSGSMIGGGDETPEVFNPDARCTPDLAEEKVRILGNMIASLNHYASGTAIRTLWSPPDDGSSFIIEKHYDDGTGLTVPAFVFDVDAYTCLVGSIEYSDVKDLMENR